MNRTSVPSRTARCWLLGSLLALGAAVAWFWVVGIIESVIEQWLPRQFSESITVTRNGDVLISYYGGPSGAVLRTLTGQPVVDMAGVQEASSASCSTRNTRNVDSELEGWIVLINAFRDTRLPPTYWYIMSQQLSGAGGYFAGFDSRSKQPVGYLGLGGFRADVPPPSEQFDARVAGAGASARAGLEPIFDNSVPYVFLVSDGALYRFDLSDRSVRKIDLPAAVKSVTNLPELSGTSGDIQERQQLAIRTEDKILVAGFDGKLARTIAIPESLRNEDFELTHWADGTSIFASRDSYRVSSIDWVDAQGQVTRHETVQLLSTDLWELIRRWMWQTAAACPFPIVLAYFFGVVFANTLVMFRLAPNFGTAVGMILGEGRPALLLVCLLAVALVPVVLKRQKQFAARGTVGWVLLVLLMGPAGLVGYLVHRHWPVLRRCDACGRTVPIDSLECAVCEAEMPLPALKGIEILA